MSQNWIILRTAGPRTLPLWRSLASAGFEAWTPVETVTQRRPRTRDERTIERPILPTFVFASADRLVDVLGVLRAPINPHPGFSLVTHAGRVPVVAEREIAGLRAAEADAVRAAERRLRKTHREAFGVGQAVTVKDGAWTGLTGVVEGGDDRFARVVFRSGMSVKISTFLLIPDAVFPVRSLENVAA